MSIYILFLDVGCFALWFFFGGVVRLGVAIWELVSLVIGHVISSGVCIQCVSILLRCGGISLALYERQCCIMTFAHCIRIVRVCFFWGGCLNHSHIWVLGFFVGVWFLSL